MRPFLLSLCSTVFLAGCACQTKQTDSATAQGKIPSVLEPNHGMSASKAAGFGAAAQFLK